MKKIILLFVITLSAISFAKAQKATYSANRIVAYDSIYVNGIWFTSANVQKWNGINPNYVDSIFLRSDSLIYARNGMQYSLYLPKGGAGSGTGKVFINYGLVQVNDSTIAVDSNIVAPRSWVLSKLFSGNYSDLNNPPVIPTLVSQLSNDANYTTINDAASSTTSAYSSNKINSLLNSQINAGPGINYDNSSKTISIALSTTPDNSLRFDAGGKLYAPPSTSSGSGVTGISYDPKVDDTIRLTTNTNTIKARMHLSDAINNGIWLPAQNQMKLFRYDGDSLVFNILGGGNYIQNGTSVQSNASFNISGDGKIGGNLTVTGTVTTSGAFESSDARLKNIIGYGSPFVIDKMKPILFTWKNEQGHYPFHYGYVAQDVAKILPSVVHHDDKGYLSVNYTELHTVEIANLYTLIQNQQKEIELLREEIKLLQSK